MNLAIPFGFSFHTPASTDRDPYEKELPDHHFGDPVRRVCPAKGDRKTGADRVCTELAKNAARVPRDTTQSRFRLTPR